MIITTLFRQYYSFTAKSIKYTGEHLIAVASDGTTHKIPMKDLVSVFTKKDLIRVTHINRIEISGCQVKKIVHSGGAFSELILSDGSKALVNKKLHKLYKD